MSFPILEKCGTWASPVPRRSEKWLYRYGRMALPGCKPLQRLEIGFRKRQNPFVGNYTSGMAKPRILAFLRLLRLRCLNDKTSHRLQNKANGYCRKLQIFDRREREMSNLDGWPSGNLPCIVSPSPLHDLLRIQPHPQNARWSHPLESDCISPIGIYKLYIYTLYILIHTITQYRE